MRCNISYEREKAFESKNCKFCQNIITNHIFKILVPRHLKTQISCKANTIFGNETWTIRMDERRLVPAEMHFISRPAGYTIVDFKRNEEIKRELQIPQITDFTEYRWNWKETLSRWAVTGLHKNLKKKDWKDVWNDSKVYVITCNTVLLYPNNKLSRHGPSCCNIISRSAIF